MDGVMLVVQPHYSKRQIRNLSNHTTLPDSLLANVPISLCSGKKAKANKNWICFIRRQILEQFSSIWK